MGIRRESAKKGWMTAETLNKLRIESCPFDLASWRSSETLACAFPGEIIGKLEGGKSQNEVG